METEGNISARLGKDRVLVSPKHVPYERRAPSDVVLVDLGGHVLRASREPTSELGMHLAIYRARDDIGAIVHSHPIYSSVLAVMKEPLRPILDEMVPYLGGSVGVAKFAPFGSKELAGNVVGALGPRSAVLLANHGLLCTGKNLARALQITRYVEKWSHIQVLSMILGKADALPEKRQKEAMKHYRFLKDADC